MQITNNHPFHNYLYQDIRDSDLCMECPVQPSSLPWL